jgi:transcription termination factor Rho
MDELTANPVTGSTALPAELQIDQLHTATQAELLDRAAALGVRANRDRSRNQLTLDLLRAYAGNGVSIFAEGIIELAAENYGFLRWARCNFRPGPDDVYVPPALLKSHFLRNGNKVGGRLRPPREKEKFMAVEELTSIEGRPVSEWKETRHFDSLTAQFPNERIILENPVTKAISVRAVDLIAPLGRGQRCLIVSPPRAGKTILLKDIALAIRANSPESQLILLLIDERPEEVTDLRRQIDAEIYSSTFDESPTRHVQLAELVSARARRLVELKKHVIIMLDSITRLSRGYNALQGKGRTMSGGVDSKALAKPKKFFSSARNVEEGGSLTIIATALTETQSRMDEVIFEEFKGTGNMELHLDRSIAELRIFPAIHVMLSATRREELLYHPDELERVHFMRKKLADLPAAEAIELLLDNLEATKTNAELLLAGLR